MAAQIIKCLCLTRNSTPIKSVIITAGPMLIDRSSSNELNLFPGESKENKPKGYGSREERQKNGRIAVDLSGRGKLGKGDDDDRERGDARKVGSVRWQIEREKEVRGGGERGKSRIEREAVTVNLKGSMRRGCDRARWAAAAKLRRR
ncbi:hypothetical protein PIB30_072770 [Stylosanthes scabra]|uniref:Uncharacterized protein n=1 Tax=Stylosanthes scabra TaxID=79078 RepID=A0ABU6VNM7_9FABA|nr:hypothetical protein [Stylosanthes scabra]